VAGTQVVTTGYTPREHQAFVHKNKRRFNVLVFHRRFGKTHLSANEMIHCGLQNKLQNPQYAYIAPTYGQAKRVAWDVFKGYLQNIPFVEFNESELRADIKRPASRDRVRIMLLGAENPGALRGLYLDGVVLDEYAEMNPEVWSMVIRPALSDRLGWAIFIGTPKGQNHFYEIYMLAEGKADWFRAIFKASQTGIIAKAELEAAAAIMSEEEYAQEYECSFQAALTGAYYGKILSKLESKGRICGVPHDSALGVFTAWDLGVDDATAIWFFQVHRTEIRIIEYYENSGEGLEYYVRELAAKPYIYGGHIFPHDVAVRELITGKSRIEAIKTMGLKNVRVAAKLQVADGIQAVRNLLDRCWFDSRLCNQGRIGEQRGLESLKNYQKKWDSKNKIYLSSPNHNWASHGADAFRTLAVGLNEDMQDGADTAKSRLPRECDNKFDIV
jgi:phage terminase large subunit